jgi:hypothetical protein
MTRERASGAALIAGAVLGLATMALHPTGSELAQGVGRSVWPALLNVFAHSLAIASCPLMLFGAFGFTRRLSTGYGLADLALATYAFALVAVMSAAIASGFIAPHVIEALGHAEGQRPIIGSLFHFNYQVNQAYAKVFVVLSAIAIVLWSVAILRARSFARGIGIFGCVVGGLLLIGMVSGHLRLNLHGFGTIMLIESAWLIAVGVTLYRAENLTQD